MLFDFFVWEACGILGPWPEMEPIPPALEGEVLTSGPFLEFWCWLISFHCY